MLFSATEMNSCFHALSFDILQDILPETLPSVEAMTLANDLHVTLDDHDRN